MKCDRVFSQVRIKGGSIPSLASIYTEKQAPANRQVIYFGYNEWGKRKCV
jgi:hypothetical protein